METCARALKNGNQCQRKRFVDSEGATHMYCKLHNRFDQGEVIQCAHICKNGNRCKFNAMRVDGAVYLTKCAKHDGEDEEKRLADRRNGIPSGAALLDL